MDKQLNLRKRNAEWMSGKNHENEDEDGYGLIEEEEEERD
jgi:hypothetical protein